MDVHPYIRLIEYALENKSFSIEQACTATKFPLMDFQRVQEQLFLLDEHQRENTQYYNLEMQWRVRPEALFGYIQFQAYRDAVESANKADQRALIATRISISALIISSLIGISAIIV